MSHNPSSLLKSALAITALGVGFIASIANAHAAPAPRPDLTISIPAEINLGDTAQIIVNAKVGALNVPGLPISHLRLDFPIVIDPDTLLEVQPPSVQLIAPADNYITDAAGNVSVNFDPQALDIPANCGYTMRAQSAGIPQTYQTSNTVSLSFCIKDVACQEPFTFALTDVSGPGELLVSTKGLKYSGDWYLTYTVKTCTDIVAGTKVQGGVVAWANFLGTSVSTGNVSTSSKNKNTVITWVLPALTAGDEHTIVVHLSGTSANVAGTQPLSGAWSAVYQTLAEANNVDLVTGLPAPIAAHKSAYTPRATYEVVTTLTP